MQRDACSRCDMAFNIGDALSHTPGANFAASYDSLKYAHENCYDNSRAPAFQTMEIDVQEGGIGTGPDSWTEFRQWLLSVLPIRHDATWFCSDLFAICLLYTSPSPRDRQKSRMP